jgi:prepilin-type N-terminal cleavage/methylation domain-containing protein
MVCRRNQQVDGQPGFTLVELVTIVAIIGIVSVGAIPLFMTFLKGMETRGAAQELTTLLQQARGLAIARNTNYTVQIDTNGNQLRFVDGSGAPWVGPSTDGSGYRRLVNQVRLAAANANPVFNPLGTAGGGRITVQNSQGTSALDVIVSPAGRVRIAQVGQ